MVDFLLVITELTIGVTDTVLCLAHRDFASPHRLVYNTSASKSDEIGDFDEGWVPLEHNFRLKGIGVRKLEALIFCKVSEYRRKILSFCHKARA